MTKNSTVLYFVSRAAFKLLLCFGAFNFLSCSHTPPLSPHRYSIDNDQQAIDKPKAEAPHDYWDIISKSTFYPLISLIDIPQKFIDLFEYVGWMDPQEARNVNSFDEVADSSWFTNRIGMFPFEPEQMIEAFPPVNGPDFSDKLTVTSAKEAGITPGFFAKDKKGVIYVIKFDHPSQPEMATSADVISTALFYAIGFHVPKSYIVSIPIDKIELSSKATTRDRYGNKVPFTKDRLKVLLTRVDFQQGLCRALASKFLDGRWMGPFSFTGTRWSDPQDRVKHQNRRELRAYRMFAAWLNHTDSRGPNTLDMFIKTKGDKGYVRHNLIDFGATLGSSTAAPKGHLAGYIYAIDYKDIAKGSLLFGFYDPLWLKVKPLNDPSLGYLRSDLFDPPSWKPTYQNPTFDKMTLRDAYWATKIIMKLSDAHIKKAISYAKYSDPRSGVRLLEILIDRRDKIGAYYFTHYNPADDFRVFDTNGIQFKNLAQHYGILKSDSLYYKIRWKGESSFDTVRGEQIRIPSMVSWDDKNITYFEIKSYSEDEELGESKRVSLQRFESGVKVVGIW